MPILQIITGRAAAGLAVLAFIPGAIAGVLALSPWTWVKLMARGGILVGSMLTYFLGLTIFQPGKCLRSFRLPCHYLVAQCPIAG